MYEIRLYRPDDRERLRSLIRNVWPERPPQAFDCRWWWYYEKPPLFVAEEKGTGAIVGVCASPPFSLFSRDKTVSGVWFVDFFVLNEHKGKGLGKALSRAVMEQCPVTASLSQTDEAWAVFKKLGWHERQVAKLYLNPMALLPGVVPVLNALGAADPSVRIERCAAADITADDYELNNLWETLRTRYEALTLRDAGQLRVRYGLRSDREYLMLRAYRAGRLCAYMMIRICPPSSLRSLKRYFIGRYPLGLVADYLVDPDEPLVFATLLDAASRVSMKQGAKSLLCLSTVPAFHHALVSRGFLHGSTPLLGHKLSTMDVSFTYYNRPGHEELASCGWYLTLGDCDMDLTWGESPV
jgi:GNAT superfamily N-acetyltransferase